MKKLLYQFITISLLTYYYFLSSCGEEAVTKPPQIIEEIISDLKYEPEKVCAPGEKKCISDKIIKTCKSDGTGYIETECTYKCINNECKEKICEPLSKKCKSDKILLICDEFGLNVTNFTCPEICFKDDCAPAPTCTVGQKICDESGKFLKTCIKEGDTVKWKWEKCEFGCKNSACQKPVCNIGDVRCNPQNQKDIEECNIDQTGWKYVMTCIEGCLNGKCVDHPCSLGEKRCNYYTVEICKDDLSGFAFLEACPNGCVQVGKNAFCANCPAGAKKCSNDNKVMVCNDPSKGWETQMSCSPLTCINGYCGEEVILFDDLSTYENYMSIVQAFVNCWKKYKNSPTNKFCGSINTELYSKKITKEDLIDNWYCYYLFFEDEFESPGDLEIAEELFSCYDESKRLIDIKNDILPGVANKNCFWYDVFAVDEIIVDYCEKFSE